MTGPYLVVSRVSWFLGFSPSPKKRSSPLRDVRLLASYVRTGRMLPPTRNSYIIAADDFESEKHKSNVIKQTLLWFSDRLKFNWGKVMK